MDKCFIEQVARDQGIKEDLPDHIIKAAHLFASQGDPQDYYYRLKEYFYS